MSAAGLRNRVLEFLPAVDHDDLIANDRNWREHPYAQRRAIAELLDQVGIAGALTAYRSDRNDGKLTLIDGHERHDEHPGPWPVLVLDVTDDEADLLLTTLDPLVGMAEPNADALAALVADASTGTPALEELLRELRLAAIDQQTADAEAAADQVPDTLGPPEMELQPFEHYDYLVVLFRSSLDWAQACERFGIDVQSVVLKDGETRRTGRGRVIDGARLIEQLSDR